MEWCVAPGNHNKGIFIEALLLQRTSSGFNLLFFWAGERAAAAAACRRQTEIISTRQIEINPALR